MLHTAPNFSRNVDWNLLKTFHEIVEAQGVSRAGRALRRKQPALSLALKRLEAALEVKLCRRGPGGFELTDEGMLVAETCSSLSTLVRSVPRKLSNLTEDLSGRLSIQVISSLVCERFDAAIARFHDQHPNVEILIDIAPWDSVVVSLLRDKIDVGVATAQSFRADLDYDFLFDEAHGAYCGRTHKLYGSNIDDPSELSAHGFILTGADEPDVLTAYRARHGLGLKVSGLSEHLDEAKRLAMLGIGICFLPEAFAAADVAAGRLWPLLKNADQPAAPIFVMTNPHAAHKLVRQRLLAEIGLDVGSE